MTKREPLLTLLRQGLAAGRQPRIALAYAASFAARADLVIVALFLSLWVRAPRSPTVTRPPTRPPAGCTVRLVQGCAMLWAPFFGWLADRINRVTLVILATLLWIAGYGWMGRRSGRQRRDLGAAAMLGIGQAAASSPRRC